MRTGNKLYWLTQAATLYVAGLFAWEIKSGGLHPVEANPLAVYLALLGAYAADKELGRWASRRDLRQAPRERKGSWIVVAWVAFYFAAHSLHAWDPGYAVPEGLARLVLWVVGIFFGSGSSKRLFALLQDEGGAWGALEPGGAGGAGPRAPARNREAEQAAMLEFLRGRREGAGSPELAAHFGMSPRQALRYLDGLVRDGRLRVLGKFRGRRYSIK